MIAETPHGLVATTKAIGSLPSIYTKLNEVMRNPTSTVRDIGKVLAEDPVLTARLLRLVNSSFYSLPTKVETVSRAVVLVGTNELKDLVLATTVMAMFRQSARRSCGYGNLLETLPGLRDVRPGDSQAPPGG